MTVAPSAGDCGVGAPTLHEPLVVVADAVVVVVAGEVVALRIVVEVRRVVVGIAVVEPNATVVVVMVVPVAPSVVDDAGPTSVVVVDVAVSSGVPSMVTPADAETPGRPSLPTPRTVNRWNPGPGGSHSKRASTIRFAEPGRVTMRLSSTLNSMELTPPGSATWATTVMGVSECVDPDSGSSIQARASVGRNTFSSPCCTTTAVVTRDAAARTGTPTFTSAAKPITGFSSRHLHLAR